MEAIEKPIAAAMNAERMADIRNPVVEGVGAMLRERRVELGLSQSEVANVVKLPARRIEAMEMERWDELPDGPYLRGFLKNIARALKLDEATLIARVDESLMRARNPDSILVAPGSTHATLPRRSGPAEGRYSGRGLVFGALAFALIAVLIAWSGTDSFDRAVATGKSLMAARNGRGASAPPTSPAATPLVPVESQTKSESIQLPGRALPQDAVAAGNVAVNAPGDASRAGTTVPSAANGSSAMQLHFSEESWVEVRDRDGKILLSSLNAAGTDQSINGDPPFTLIVGNAKGVSVSYRGRPVDLTPYTRDQVARFTLS